MCGGCWTPMGHPTIYNGRVAQAVNLITLLYELEPTGGPLHPAVDDWNLEGDNLTVYHDCGDYSDEVFTVADELADLLRAMGLSERVSALAHQEGLLEMGRPTAAGEDALWCHRRDLLDGDIEDEAREIARERVEGQARLAGRILSEDELESAIQANEVLPSVLDEARARVIG